MRLIPLVALLTSAACARGGEARQGEQADASNSNGGPHDAPSSQNGDDDAPTPPPDAAHPDAAPDAPPMVTGATLLLTEVVLAPSTGEFIEIANPTAAAIDLSTYYLSDSGNYFQTPTGSPTVDSTDFIVKFPAGSSIPAHGVITVAIDTTANFTTTYGAAPTYSVASGTMTSVAAVGVPSLTNAGEIVVLFKWDGQSDLVKDVDIVLAGAPTTANGLVDKSGVAIDGPDSGTTATAYATDARTMPAQASTPASGKSTKRILPETGHETQSGVGNGLTGDDETSEDTAVTWDSTAFTIPTPGTVPTTVVP